MPEHSPPYLCPACGYDIDPPEDAIAFVCPECGNETDRLLASKEAQGGRTQQFYRRAAVWMILPQALGSTVTSLLMALDDGGDRAAVFGGLLILMSAIALPVAPVVVFVLRARVPNPFRERVRIAPLILMFFASIVAWLAWMPALLFLSP